MKLFAEKWSSFHLIISWDQSYLVAKLIFEKSLGWSLLILVLYAAWLHILHLLLCHLWPELWYFNDIKMILPLLGREMILRSILAISLMYFLPLLMYSCVLSKCENTKLQNSLKSYKRHRNSSVTGIYKSTSSAGESSFNYL